MKKMIRFLVATLVILLMLVPMMTAYADSGTNPATTSASSGTDQVTTVVATDKIQDVLIDNVANIVQTIIITLLGVLGTWLSIKLSGNAKLKNINEATQAVIKTAQLTAGELKQTIVDDLKAGHSDGKLTEDEIETLKNKLQSKTYEKLSAPILQLLNESAVDVQGLIAGAGEAWIEKVKRDPQLLASELISSD
ncbi:hypothetical protein SDC9_40174 [bioreactor metagenome]|uniref:Uncharacterized protein n=1 Tax=bioreactor metagenome TaxID=1076179 RepID=A0A644VRR8_9ZZZZ